MKSGQLPQLIQGMYGAVLGVSIVKLVSEGNGDKAISVETLLTGDNLFKIFFCLFTLAIAAHDWFSFHREHDERPRRFGNYFIQILAIFSIGQMFSFANYKNFHLWYMVAILYVVCNMVRGWAFEGEKFLQGWNSMIHLALAFGGFWYFKDGDRADSEKLVYWIITVGVVVLIWFRKDYLFNKKDKDKVSLAISAGLLQSNQEVNTIRLDDFDFTAKQDALEKFLIVASFDKGRAEQLIAKFPRQEQFIKELAALEKITDKERSAAIVGVLK